MRLRWLIQLPALCMADEQQSGSVTAEQVPDNNDEKKWNHVFADDDAARIAAAASGSETITASTTAIGATGVTAPRVEPVGWRRSCERRHRVFRRADRLLGTPPTRLQVRMCNRISTHNILSMNHA